MVATINRDLMAEAAAGRFREDLAYRLNVIEIHLPSLCERREDLENRLTQAMVLTRTGLFTADLFELDAVAEPRQDREICAADALAEPGAACG